MQIITLKASINATNSRRQEAETPKRSCIDLTYLEYLAFAKVYHMVPTSELMMKTALPWLIIRFYIVCLFTYRKVVWLHYPL